MQSCVHCHCLLQSFFGDKEPCYVESGWTLARLREWNFLLCLGVSSKIYGESLQFVFCLFAASAHTGDLVRNKGNISRKQTLSTIELLLQRQ